MTTAVPETSHPLWELFAERWMYREGRPIDPAVSDWVKAWEYFTAGVMAGLANKNRLADADSWREK